MQLRAEEALTLVQMQENRSMSVVTTLFPLKIIPGSFILLTSGVIDRIFRQPLHEIWRISQGISKGIMPAKNGLRSFFFCKRHLHQTALCFEKLIINQCKFKVLSPSWHQTLSRSVAFFKVAPFFKGLSFMFIEVMKALHLCYKGTRVKYLKKRNTKRYLLLWKGVNSPVIENACFTGFCYEATAFKIIH